MGKNNVQDLGADNAANDEATPDAIDAPPARVTASLRDWLVEGLRAALFLRFRLPAPEPSPAHFFGLIAVTVAVFLGAERWAVPGEARFSLQGWLAHWWSIALTILVVWGVFVRWRPGDIRRPAVVPWYALTSSSSIVVVLVVAAYQAAWYRQVFPEEWRESAWAMWGFASAVWAWMAAVAMRVAAKLGLMRTGRALLGILLVSTYVANAFLFHQYRPWYPVPAGGDEEPQRNSFVLDQETIDAQLAVRDRAFMDLLPERHEVRDVYAIVFAPYAAEDVFRRESQLVADVLRERFDAQGRLLQLLNHRESARALPWANTENLRRAIQTVAGKMNRQQDILVLYLTSHGARDFKLAAEHWPLQVRALTAAELRQALDDAGVRNRVIMVSACYSGGWLEPLASDTTLIMTAADAEHTSYGCGHRSPLTFFGRALWDEQLRRTHDFEEAFAKALPVIRQREDEAQKPDGFSNPQIRVGDAIRPVLLEMTHRLDAAAVR